VGDVEVKEKLFAAHQRCFGEAKKRREELVRSPELVKKILKEGAEKAMKVSSATLKEVYETVGIVN